MDKQTFYTALSEKLVTLGVGREYIDRHMKQFDNYFGGKTEEEISSEIDQLGDLDRVAARIKRITDKIIEQEAKEKEEAGTAPDVEEDGVSSSETSSAEGHANGSDSAGSPAEPSDDSPTPEAQADPEKTPREKSSSDAESGSDDFDFESVEDDLFDEATSSESFPKPKREERIAMEPDEISDDVIYGYPDTEMQYEGQRRGEDIILPPERIVKNELDENTIRRNTLKFRLLFILTLPITIAVLIATVLVFAILYFVIAVLIIAFVAALVAVTAIGTLVSVFGLIFGIAQLLSNLPIGLYECGLSIIIGACALAVGIILYNIAVRLLPFVGKWLWVFFKFVFRKYKELYIFLKKEVIGL